MEDLCYQLEAVVLRGSSPADEISAAQKINRTPMIAGLNGQYPVEAMVRLVQTRTDGDTLS